MKEIVLKYYTYIIYFTYIMQSWLYLLAYFYELCNLLANEEKYNKVNEKNLPLWVNSEIE